MSKITLTIEPDNCHCQFSEDITNIDIGFAIKILEEALVEKGNGKTTVLEELLLTVNQQT